MVGPRRAIDCDVLAQSAPPARAHPPATVRLRDLHLELGVSRRKAEALVAQPNPRIRSFLIDGCRVILSRSTVFLDT